MWAGVWFVAFVLVALAWWYDGPRHAPAPPRAEGPRREGPRRITTTRRIIRVRPTPPRPIPMGNAPTRPFEVVGVMTASDEPPRNSSRPTVLPLYGRPTDRRSTARWHYYTRTEEGLRLPVYESQGGRDCMGRHRGCAEAFDGTTLFVQPHGTYTVDLYDE